MSTQPLPAGPIYCGRAEYYAFKLLPEGDPLVAYGTSNVARDVLGNEMKCQGLWHSKESVGKVRAAMQILHSSYDDLRGEYKNSCSDCIKRHALVVEEYTQKKCQL